MSTEHRPVPLPGRDSANLADPAGKPASNLGGGTVRMSTRYVDEHGQWRRAREPGVPVDQYGVVTSTEFRCAKCKGSKWVSRAVAAKGHPACDVDGRRMARLPIKSPPVLPWDSVWKSAEPALRPAWVAVAVAGVAAAQVPAGVLLAGAAPVGFVAGRLARRVMLRRLVARRRREMVAAGRSKAEATAALAPVRLADELGARRLATVARRARAVGYGTASACGWAALAGAAGMDPATVGGDVSWTLLAALAAYPAASWWRWLRSQRKTKPEDVPVVVEAAKPDTDPDEAAVRRIWTRIVAAEQGEIVGKGLDGQQVKTKRSGKLPGTWLEDWHKVEGGWAATAVGPDGTYTSAEFLAARPAIAAAFKMKAIMVTIIPDEEDENRALVSTQRTTPIREDVRWTGPDSISVEDGQTWRAPIAQYKDMSFADYELLRWEWGTPHDFLCGTTGAGKSETLSTLLTIDRWAHFTDANGVKRGLVADLLIDPQQGQSYGPFLDDLAAPVATSLEEATLMVTALKNEMKRRNRYLSRVQWPDPKRRKRDGSPVMRKGRKWWNPLVDGPIITLNIDEAHEFLSDKKFAALVTSGARMYRKCGIRIRVATHTPLLTDLGGSMALRSMLTGGFVWVGRTADSLSGPVAFNGRLQVDPRTIPEVPGMAFLLSGMAPKPMLVRSMWEPDFYDWVRNEFDEPVGFPAHLPAETLEAFGPEFAAWCTDPDGVAAAAADTQAASDAANAAEVRVDAVQAVLLAAASPMDMNQLDAALREAGTPMATGAVRAALKSLRDAGLVFSSGRPVRHELTPQAREEAALTAAEERGP